MIDVRRLRALDTETFLLSAGALAPKLVCASTTALGEEPQLLVGQESIIYRVKKILASDILVAANAPYDLAALGAAEPRLLPDIFRVLREGRVYDVLMAETLNAIYHGHLGLDPRTGKELRKPSTNEVTKRYSLEVVCDLVLGRIDAKAHDAWRSSYALLHGTPVDRWPEAARIYPKDDAVNPLDVAAAQIEGRLGVHEWVDVPKIPDGSTISVCVHCSEELGFSEPPTCPNASRVAHMNLDNLSAQVEAAFALHLGAAWSLRTDPERVAKLATDVEAKQTAAVERFQKTGWIRADGTEDQAAVKRSIALAYGAMGTCSRCNGSGRVQSVWRESCRGLKVKGRYKGCAGAACTRCDGSGEVEKYGGSVTCKVEGGEGCDGTGFDLGTAPMLPRADKGGVKADRDVKSESGDEELAAYGEDEFQKSLSTYLPYLRTGIYRPLSYSSNALVATGRCSYEGSPLHQMPRKGLERGCIRARGAWCGSPIEYVLGSTDYEAGELVTLSTLIYWLFDKSSMRDAINASGKPGILHSDLAAEVLRIPLDDFLVRLKAKDKQAIDFRQMCKPINFGVPGLMGVTTLVLTSRKKSAGFTVCENGPARNEKGQPGYWGVRFCVLAGAADRCGETKILEWKRYTCAPVCKMCVSVVHEALLPSYHRRYPEVKDYFKWAEKMIKDKKPAPVAVWDAVEDGPKVIRERGGCEPSAFCNNGFQGMLSDIGKDAFVRATRECYLGVKDDGSPSPLAGCHIPLYLHDEPLSELIAETAHLSGPRIAEIMVESGEKLAPGVVWKAETSLMKFWDKSAEPVYQDGKLVLWEPRAA